MTTFLFKHALTKEINQLNRIIDKKIARGESYVREARLHKRLFAKLQSIKHGSRLAVFL